MPGCCSPPMPASPALEAAADHNVTTVNSFGIIPLSFMPVPHHGSRHNIGPSILDLILGPKDGAPFAQVSAVISSAAADPDHPKFVNAFTRRGCYVVATEGRTVLSHRRQHSWIGSTPVGEPGPGRGAPSRPMSPSATAPSRSSPSPTAARCGRMARRAYAGRRRRWGHDTGGEGEWI